LKAGNETVDEREVPEILPVNVAVVEKIQVAIIIVVTPGSDGTVKYQRQRRRDLR
jgi:hypothetical protein